MRWVLLAAVVLGFTCTDSMPCSTCPPIEGVWFLQYVQPTFPCDAGAPAAPPPTVQLTREGSVIRTAIDGIALSGTLYDTFDFSMNGQALGGGETVSMRGVYKPQSHADAGDEQLVDGTLARDTAACREERRFTGARY